MTYHTSLALDIKNNLDTRVWPQGLCRAGTNARSVCLLNASWGGAAWPHPPRVTCLELALATDLALKQTQTQGTCPAVAGSSGCDPGQGYKGASVGVGHGAHLDQARSQKSEEAA